MNAAISSVDVTFIRVMDASLQSLQDSSNSHRLPAARPPRESRISLRSCGLRTIRISMIFDRNASGAMIEMTYDPEADAAYIYLSRGCTIASTGEVSPFICDFDSEDRVIGIEIIDVSKVLSPGDW